MKIQSANKVNEKPPRVLAISKTVIPLDYDKSTQGFNHWTVYVRNELHVNSLPFDAYQVIAEAKKILNYYKTPLNVRKR